MIFHLRDSFPEGIRWHQNKQLNKIIKKRIYVYLYEARISYTSLYFFPSRYFALETCRIPLQFPLDLHFLFSHLTSNFAFTFLMDSLQLYVLFMSLSQEKLLPQKHEIQFPFIKKFLWQKPKCKYAYTGIKQSSLCNFFHLENQRKLKEHKNDLLLLPARKSVPQAVLLVSLCWSTAGRPFPKWIPPRLPFGLWTRWTYPQYLYSFQLPQIPRHWVPSTEHWTDKKAFWNCQGAKPKHYLPPKKTVCSYNSAAVFMPSSPI